MDPALERLVLDNSCHTDAGAIGDGPCVPDHAAFISLIAQYGFAFTPTAMHSAKTVGYGGFQFSLEGNYTTIDNDAEYWKRGTQGTRDTSTGAASVVGNPAGVLQLYSAKVRKSFGFGLELTGVAGFMPSTSFISTGADIRMSLLEGFRSGIGGALPDFAVGGAVRTTMGTPQFHLTVVTIDAQVSKPLPIAESSVITPWLGYQYAWTFGDSGVVDFTPQTDPLGFCDYTGDAVPGTPPTTEAPDAPPPPYNGSPVCKEGVNGQMGSTVDFNNNQVFDNARVKRQRGLVGLSFRHEVVNVGFQFIFDLFSPGETQTGDSAEAAALKDMGRQYSFVAEAGTQF